MRVTLDTNVLLSATLWKGSVANRMLGRLIEENALVFTTEPILAEYTLVLDRDFEYSAQEIEVFVTWLRNALVVVHPRVSVSIVKEDPSDDRIIECALASGSEYLITYDKHLLRLRSYGSVQVLTPEQIIRLIYL